MELYFLRHGEADWPEWKKSDDERPLTKRGKREMRDVAKFLDRLKVRPNLIVTSPLPRAAQTAEIAADYLKAKLRKDELLAPGFGASKLATVLSGIGARVLMLVGHEPDFTQVISELTGASPAFQGRRRLGRSILNPKKETSLAFPAKIAKK
jgi:phosphohistidine phosphatase